MMENELPEGWAEVRIGEIYNFIGGGTPSKAKSSYWNGEIPWASIKDISQVDELISTQDFISEEGLKDSASNLAQIDEVIIGTRMSLGKPVLTKIITSINQDLKIVRPRLPIPPLFTFYLFKFLRTEFESKSSGTTVKGIRLEVINEIRFPLPPLAEQKHIVAKLDAAFGHLETLKTSLNRIPELLKKFRQNVLTQAVTGKLTEGWREENPDIESLETFLKHISKSRERLYQKLIVEAKEKGERLLRKPNNLDPKIIKIENTLLPQKWGVLTFEDISSVFPYSISSGPFGSALGTKDYKKEGIPVIRGQNVQSGHFVNDNFVFISLEKANELKRSAALPGDIVIVAVGAGVGNAAIVPEIIELGILSQNCNKFSLDQQLVHPNFILYCLQISGLKQQMNEFTTDTARQFLSLTNLKKIYFNIPPFEEQQEIVQRVEALFAQADALEAQYESLKAKIEKLPQALLSKAFRGELVPQDPTDEPAAVLLQKIKAEAVKGGKKKEKSGQVELAF